MPRIVVVGGGFAGINFIKTLSKNSDVEIVLVDKNNYHFFPPLLYQVATSFIEPSNIAYPFRKLFQLKKNIRFHFGSLIKVNREENNIETTSGVLKYDYLVLAMGTEPNFFGMENVRKNALPMKTIDDALDMRNHILLNMEKAAQAKTVQEKEKHLNIVIAGGGPTGVEVAGMLAEMSTHLEEKEYPEVTDVRSNIYLVDAMPVLLQPMSIKSQNEAHKVLKKLGVKILLNTAVKDYSDGKVVFSDGKTIETEVLIWASGVVAPEVEGLADGALGRGKRILVDEYSQVKGSINIFAIGDISLITEEPNFAGGHPQLAQVAIQQGRLLAKNLQSVIAGKSLKTPFRYHDKGSMAIISKYKAVVDIPENKFIKGFLAWLTWLLIHIVPLVGFGNRSKILFNWIWAFVTNDPALRLIIGNKRKKQENRF
ncbi:NAD(P)/FAD-dependent oxidoreductase [Chryseobacterium sp. Leaf394]|uniref:NAD(P)/FAD-dependent oxidoreductase n=1 Tax=Chryseobacterium sp. Leaf394 TaxID=1736361 RepID=UPI0007015769|nr:NAD(P)/FAD-dependent oxidoreductase [Chryseobacterium sp. Leaf394]KQS91962.1 NADH dehydrogenase [Chryseobacterium sp. Leaf394]